MPDGGEVKSLNVDAEIHESLRKDKSRDVILYPIVFKLSGRSIDKRFVQPQKASISMFSMPSGRSTSTKPEQLKKAY